MKINLLFLTVFISTSLLGQTTESALDILNPKSIIKEIFSGGEGLLLEGPAMGPDGNLYFSDVIFTQYEGMKAGIIWKYNPKTEETKVFRSPSGMSNGLAFDIYGNLIACEGADFGGRRVIKTNLSSGKSTIAAALFDDKPFNSPNDVVVDNKGRIYFTDPRYFGAESIDQPVNGVYRIDADGSVHIIIGNASQPNGIAISPDNKKLYVTNYDFGYSHMPAFPKDFKGPRSKIKGAILEYELLPDGNVKYKGILVNYKDEGPDGLKVDTEGNIYAAVGGNVVVYSPVGKKLIDINVPNRGAKNLCFGRDEFNKTLFITTNKKLYSLPIKKEGYHVPFQTKN